MVIPILVVSTDPSQPQRLIDLLRNRPYAIDHCESVDAATGLLSAPRRGIVIFDIDGMDLNERYFRELAEKPGLCMMALSSRLFHPDLKEAIGRHLIACLRKPIDPDELLFLLDSIAKNGCDRRR
ncbi:MAG: hypothetical protein ACOWWM_10300 [Desulfobacterales bacterium]